MSPTASAADRAPGRSRAQHRNVLISGAGPAGLTLAYWLSRHGFSPTLVERAPAPRDGGQAVDIRGAAIDVARQAGILGALRQAYTRTRGDDVRQRHRIGSPAVRGGRQRVLYRWAATSRPSSAAIGGPSSANMRT